jgi:carboxyl-terminal processing protease
VIDLNQFVRNGDVGDLGALKRFSKNFIELMVVLQKSEQRYCNARQVCYLKMGERDVDNAMPWDKIDPAVYAVWDKSS